MIIKMSAYKFLTKFCIILLLLSVGSCSTRAISNRVSAKTVTYLIPENFEGGVVIVYAQKDGVTPEITENEIVFAIPADGILKVNIDEKTVSGKPTFFFVGKNGERTEIELLYAWGPKYPEGMRSTKDISDDERDNKVFAAIFENGTFNTASGVVRFSSFTVGKPKDYKILIHRTHGKVSDLQRTFPR